MDILENRAISFKAGWPLSLTEYKVTPDTLTAAGWFFNADKKHLDACQCYLCEKQLDGWEPNDQAFPEHVSHSGKCPLTRLHEIDARKDTFSHSFANNNGVVNSGTNGIRKRGHAQLYKKVILIIYI